MNTLTQLTTDETSSGLDQTAIFGKLSLISNPNKDFQNSQVFRGCRFSAIFDKGYNFSSRKHAYTILTPLNPTFYKAKLGFTGVYIIFLISAQKHRLWVLVRTASSIYAEAVPTSTHNLCFDQKYIKYRNFLSENFHFWW